MEKIVSKDKALCMYDYAEEYYKLAKTMLSSEYGMMVTKLSDSDKETIKQAYKSGKTHAYFDTDSSQLEGGNK